ncbi:MAG TPA: hypothetical protein VKX17_25390 [Planctomycetota bacterium]|nr:hypothetical protein [Planctomycetota bacterium]
MDDPNTRHAVSATDTTLDDSLIDYERSKGLPEGVFIGKDGHTYGFDEEKATRENARIGKKINRRKLRAVIKKLKPARAELEKNNPEF